MYDFHIINAVGLYLDKGGSDMAENFVTIELSRKQVDVSNLVHNDKTDKDYARVFAPGGGSYLYPVDSIKVKSDNPERVYFSRPEGTEIQVQYGHRIEGVPDDAPNEEKWENETRTWKIEDLKAAYDKERREFAEKNSAFVNMTVPSEWGTHISNDKGEFVSISIPIEKVYYSFIVPADRFNASDREEGMSYFGFPKNKKDSEEPYTITLRSNAKDEAGNFTNEEKVITSLELKKYVDEAVGYSNVKDMFVTAIISEKLKRPFSSKEGKNLYGISVPILEDKENFYEIVVPAERVKSAEEGKVKLQLFKNGPDGTAYIFTGKKSVANESGGYDEVTIKLTSEQVVDAFKSSSERFKENHKNTDMSLADAMKQDPSSQGEGDQSFRRGHGR